MAQAQKNGSKVATHSWLRQNTAGTVDGVGDGAACGVFEEYVVEAIDSATSSICSDVVTEARDDLRAAMEFGEYGLFALKKGGRGEWGGFDGKYGRSRVAPAKGEVDGTGASSTDSGASHPIHLECFSY
ncbi:hypothetical protein IEQ34_003841 [Dendrobium chrysotoxum]|uniref:Uncharacterized protein n=1 Tax=Dendrobium chrysotoxum TaxID=161865 RepID=A0AAV7HEU9_DENCH|nr:hypothetical protein IEQ34_003841 [Dendrobium chrysotoxum]